MTSPSLEDQFAAGAALEFGLHALEKWSKTPWITEHTTKLTVAFRVVLAFFATIGLQWHYVSAGGGQLTITGLSVSVLAAGVWHFFRQYAVQHGFGHLIRNGNLDAFQTIVQNVVKQAITEYMQQPAAAAVKAIAFVALALTLVIPVHAQTTSAPTAFPTSTVSFGLTPITLPSFGQTLSGAESDTMFNFTNYNQFGISTIVSSSTYIGPRYSRIFPSISTWLQNSTALQGNHYQVGLSFSGGVVEASKQQWGGDAGIFVNYAPNGSNTWGIAFDVAAAYLPGIVNADGGHHKFIPKVSIGPAFKF